MPYARVIEIIRERIDAAKAAIRARAEQGDALDAEVLRNAKRYRLIRDVPYSDDVRSVLVHQQNAAMDRVIDAAIAAQEGK